jgi:hypothetical protein
MYKKIFFQLALLVSLVLTVLVVPALAFTSSIDSSPSSNLSNIDNISENSINGVHINEVMFHPDVGSYEWVELKNSSTSPINISSFSLTDEDGNWYNIPDALPGVPAGAFVVVIFDGAGSGSDDYDFADNVATLHTGINLENIFEDDVDQLALYTIVNLSHVYLPFICTSCSSWNPHVPGPPSDFPASHLIDFVAWGAAPQDDAHEANLAGFWSPEQYVSLARGLGLESSDVMLMPEETIGLLSNSESSHPEDWILFQAAEVTQGSENTFPSISWYYPDAGATIDGNTFTISWNTVPGATGYRFQLDDNSDFSSPFADTTLIEPVYMPASSISDGAYYWRVKVLFSGGSESLWSSGTEVNSLILPPPISSTPGMTILAYKTLGITWQLQHKDTNMLCLDGDSETGNEAWNLPHAVRGIHGRNYCARASVAMLASFYGGNLSQDRITYELFKGGGPDGDLGHDVPVSYAQADSAVNWALGMSISRQNGKPTFAQIKSWIDADQPIGSTIPGHMRVIDGYFEFVIGPITWQFLHILDPWDRAKWVSYADDDIQSVWVGPSGAGGAPNVRSDEDIDSDGIADTMDDSDGDGVTDFDERNRFNLNFNVSDSDGDLVLDLADIREYVFNATGTYSLRNPDVDSDGLRKELDSDNDYAANNGAMDGCEDGDQDGKYEATEGETNNFAPSDDMSLHIRLTWPLLGSDVDLHLVRPGGVMWTYDDVYFANSNPDWGIPGVACDNPTLDIDCITQCTIENTRLSTLENGTYSVKVHYYSDHDLGPTSPQVTIWLQGTPYNFGPQQVTDNAIWDVATIDWPSGTVTATNSVLISQSKSDQRLK